MYLLIYSKDFAFIEMYFSFLKRFKKIRQDKRTNLNQ